MNKLAKQLVLVFLTLVLAIGTLSIPSLALTPNQNLNLVICSNVVIVDCVKEVSFLDDTGVKHDGIPVDSNWPRFTFPDWKFPNGGNSIGMTAVRQFDGFKYCWPDSKVCSEHDAHIGLLIHPLLSDGSWSDGNVFFPDSSDQRQCGTKSKPEICPKQVLFGASYYWRVKIIVKDFRLGLITGRAESIAYEDSNPNNSGDKIHEIVISGKNRKHDWSEVNEIRNTSPGDRNRVDYVSDRFDIALFENSALGRFPSQCNSQKIKGTVPSFMWSSYSMGQPEWNASNQSLTVDFQSPHLDDEGKPNKGFFQISIPRKVAKCLWSLDASKAVRASISISDNHDGGNNVATVTQNYMDSRLIVTASNFHFSYPKLKLKLAGLKLMCRNPDSGLTIIPKKNVCKKGFELIR